MPSQLYSSDEQRLVALANRLVNAERTRQEQGGEAATEWGAVALEFAEKEIKRIYGFNSGVQKLSLSGEDDPEKVRAIIEAAGRITESKMLTVKGRREAISKAAQSFFDTDKPNAADTKLFKDLAESGFFDQLREFHVESDAVQDTINIMRDNGIPNSDIRKVLREYVNYRRASDNPVSVYDYIGDRYPGLEWS